MLFLLYAFPCTDIRFNIGKITSEQKDELTRLVSEKIVPSRELLIACFPDAFHKIERFAKARDCDPWDHELVSFYWRYHHVGDENTPVSHREVVNIIENPRGGKQIIVAKEILGNKDLFAVNEYDLLLEQGDHITVHAFFAVEKIAK